MKKLYFNKNDEISIKELKKTIIPHKEILLMDKDECILKFTNKEAFEFIQYLKSKNTIDNFSLLDTMDFVARKENEFMYAK